MSKLLYHGNGLNTTSGDADFVNYDNTDSGLSATNVQSALDEITEDKISILSLTTAEYEAKKSEYDAMNVLIRLTDSNRTLNASNISYDDSSTSLGASDVQTAIKAVNTTATNAKSVADTANNKSIFVTDSTGKTIREYLDSMTDITTAYITYLTLFSDASDYQAHGFSQYASVTLTRISQWAEKVEIINVNGNVIGLWVGNKNETDIASVMSIYKP